MAWCATRVVRLLVVLLITVAFGRADAVAALEIHQDDIAIVEASETVDDDLLMVGGIVAMHGHVRGDLIAIGQTVQIAGRVDGDVIALGDTIQISSAIAGDLRALANRLILATAIQRNALVAANELLQGPAGRIGGRLTARVGSAILAGRVEEGVTLSADSIVIDGHLGGVARLATESLALGRTSTIDRLEFRGDTQPQFAPGSRVAVQALGPARRFAMLERAILLWRNGFRLAVDGALAASLLGAAAWVWVGGGRVSSLVTPGRIFRSPWSSIAIGCGAVIGLAILTPILLMSVAGSPAGIVLAAVAVVAVTVGWLSASVALGALVDSFGRERTRLPAPLLGLGGAALLWLVGQIPRLGGPLVLVLVIASIGALWRGRSPVHYRT